MIHNWRTVWGPQNTYLRPLIYKKWQIANAFQLWVAFHKSFVKWRDTYKDGHIEYENIESENVEFEKKLNLILIKVINMSLGLIISFKLNSYDFRNFVPNLNLNFYLYYYLYFKPNLIEYNNKIIQRKYQCLLKNDISWPKIKMRVVDDFY